ncbi:hypothetical protein J4408_04300 [Candidatus Pacearchaeota archaeon]|nr:hypothetical protein [Candidatus Pacearchaeota archaeon]
MTVTPKEATKLSRSEISQVKSLEIEIDKYLANNYNDSGKVYFSTSDNDISNDKVFTEIIRKYEKAGWKITNVSDREGDYLVFEPRRRK